MLIFLLCTFSVAVFSLALTKAFFVTDSFSSAILRTAVFSAAIILLATYIMGFFGLYRIEFIIPVCIALYAATIVVCREKHINLLENNFAGLFSELGKTEKFLAVFLAGSLAIKLVCLLCLRTYDFEGIAFRLPGIAEYIAEGRIAPIPSSVFFNSTPKNIEMFNMWALVFRRDGFYLKLPQLVFSLTGTLSVYGICRQVGCGRKNSLFSAFIFLCTPIIIAQIGTSLIDGSVVSLTAAALYFALKMRDEGSIGNIVTAGIAAGILLGTEYRAGAAVAILVTLIALSYIKANEYGSLRTVYVYALITLFAGGVWYFYNIFCFGSAFYPYDNCFQAITANTDRVLAGLTYAHWSADSLTDILKLLFVTKYNGEQNILGTFFIYGILIAVPSYLVFAIRKKKLNRLTGIIISFSVILFLLTPEKLQAGHILAVVIAGASAVALMFENTKLGPKFKPVIALVLCLSCFSGLAYDMHKLHSAAKENGVTPNVFLFRNSRYPDSFTANISKYLDNGKYTVAGMLKSISSYDLYYFGIKTQNRFTRISFGDPQENMLAESLFKLGNYKDFYYFMEENRPNYLIIDRYYGDFNLYLEKYDKSSKYKLLYEQDGVILYGR